MKILFSILLNAIILFLIAFLLSSNEAKGLESGITLGCGDKCGLFGNEALKTYIIGGVILGIINFIVRPILKILSLPLFFLFFGLTLFVINAIVLKLFGFIINDALLIPGVSYTIHGWINFIIAVAIFSILNMFYSLLLFKK